MSTFRATINTMDAFRERTVGGRCNVVEVVEVAEDELNEHQRNLIDAGEVLVYHENRETIRSRVKIVFNADSGDKAQKFALSQGMKYLTFPFADGEEGMVPDRMTS